MDSNSEKTELPNSVRLLSSLSDIDRLQWDTCANPGWSSTRPLDSKPQEIPYNPFLSYDFLSSLEESGSASDSSGWYARHLVLEKPGDAPLAVVPAYLKTHSQGEYVFDHGWADAYERAGGSYYPKLQMSVPFTPVTGRRLLIANQSSQSVHKQIVALLAAAIQQVTVQFEASSAHLTFLTEQEWEALSDMDFLRRTDQQFHWQNNGYTTYDDFLAALSSSKRKALRKERRRALENDIEIEWLTGSDLKEEHWDVFFDFYLDTGNRKWGTPYLTRQFFSLIGERMADRVLLIMAKRQGRYIAGALNFIGSDTVYGRNWGCLEDHPFLHFELCYHQAIDWAIANGYQTVEAGAQGAHKLARGYVPTTTYSAHWIPNAGFRDAVEHYLEQERLHVKMEQQALSAHAPFKKSD
ncbi:GNAT family N-acetyltransferase [Pararhizobium sp. IMCC21322]|uniref:GNAT family N-acetyltransferase n=1 Tax=Pararhizobium sp. IMCC21322 TaxID=3067903 RepID=UPI00274092C7|nr:GNAT family N-acetyltransferase [Pararhizobium sp. IMCC21322]